MKGRKQMKAPNKIYIDESRITELGGLADAIVPDNRIETSDVCYIRKDALMELLKPEKDISFPDDYERGCIDGRNGLRVELIDKLNSM